MRTNFAKLFFIEYLGDFQVLVTKEEDRENDQFLIRQRTELEFYSEEDTLCYSSESERDEAFVRYTLEEVHFFFSRVLKNYDQVPTSKMEVEA